MPEPRLPHAVGVRHRRDDVRAGVRRAGEPARQPRGGEAAAGRVAAAHGGEVGLAHEDAVLRQHHRRAVQGLVDERRDRRPARRGDVQDVGGRRRLGGGARHPVERLVELRRLHHVERRRPAGLRRCARPAPAAGPRGTTSQPRRERNTRRTPAGMRAAPDQRRRPRHRMSPFQPSSPRTSTAGSSPPRAALARAQAPAHRQRLRPHLDAPDLAGVRRAARTAAAGRAARRSAAPASRTRRAS